MELTADVRARLMSYCRIDELSVDEEQDLSRFYFAALSFMELSGVRQPEEGTARRAQYDSLVDALVLDKWDHRGSQLPQQLADNPAFVREVLQLEATEPVPDSGTEV